MTKVKRSRARWREGAPDYVLDCFRWKRSGEYTVYFSAVDYGDVTLVPYLGFNSQSEHPSYGVSQWGELSPAEFSNFRYRSRGRRIRWSDIPPDLQQHAIKRYNEPT